MSVAASLGGVLSLQSSGQLYAQAVAFAVSVIGFLPYFQATPSSSSQGMPNFVNPTFLSTLPPSIPFPSPLVNRSQLTAFLPIHAVGVSPPWFLTCTGQTCEPDRGKGSFLSYAISFLEHCAN